MLKYFISVLIFLISFSVVSQKKKVKDTVPEVYKDRYGIRLGIDVIQPIYSLFDENKKGLEIVADYRVSKIFYVAAELGYNDVTTFEDFYNFTTNGSYIKLGADVNVYKNWIGMENIILVGLRYGFSVFDQTLNDGIIDADPFLPVEELPEPVNYSGLTASWFSIVLGLKVEVAHNLFLGFSFSGNVLLSSEEPENFKNLYIPGFNRVYINNNGLSFNYTVSYLIPFYKKAN
jgi:hypothetical protein